MQNIYVLLPDGFSGVVPGLVPALGLRLRVWMPSFFIANGRFTCQRIEYKSIKYFQILLQFSILKKKIEISASSVHF